MLQNLSYGSLPNNREGYRQTMDIYAEIFTGKVFTLHDMVVEGNKVAVRWSSESTHSAEFMGIPATGNRIKETGISFLLIEEGKIVEEWAEVDMFSILMQIGMFSEKEN